MDFFNIPEKLASAADRATQKAIPVFAQLDKIIEYNQQKVLSAFIENRVSEAHFAPTTGYGYGDRGRETLETVFAGICGAQAALFRHNFVCGTHAIAVALFGVLRPGDTMLCVTGQPYDTLLGVISGPGGSLAEWGVRYKQVDLDAQGRVRKELLPMAILNSNAKMLYIQRSRGYSLRPSLSVAEIGEIAEIAKSVDPKIIVMVDNCYGEFVEKNEPTQVGADLMAGSLIKNPGGGIAPTGGYIAGRADLVEQCACRMTVPGIGGEVGATLGHSRELFMGLFNAPHVTGEALKTAVFAAALFSDLGYAVHPVFGSYRSDIIQSVTLGSEEALVAFCQGMQKGAPVDAFVTPQPWFMPGYDNKIIMAAGAFTMGASIELSADAPIREPFAAYLQGGLNFHSGKMGILLGAKSMLESGQLVI